MLGVPVILDGGIGSVADAIAAMSAGASGVLINSMLFQQQQAPVAVMDDFSKRFHQAIEELEIAAVT
jgi:thiazole synthase ThiGH ThiG subunit